MRPRTLIRGNERRMELGGDSYWGFNEAADSHPRKRQSRRSCGRVGRSFNEAADSHPRKRSISRRVKTSTSRFNEAADSHPRKPRLEVPEHVPECASMRPRTLIRGNGSTLGGDRYRYSVLQ